MKSTATMPDGSTIEDNTIDPNEIHKMFTEDEINQNIPSIPDASNTVKGVVQIGSGINVTSGVISVTPGSVPDATKTTKGAVQVGAGLQVVAGVVNSTYGKIFNVLDYPGADNTGTTDSSAAFVSAITDANAANGGTVYAPGGKYYITAGVLPVINCNFDAKYASFHAFTNANSVFFDVRYPEGDRTGSHKFFSVGGFSGYDASTYYGTVLQVRAADYSTFYFGQINDVHAAIGLDGGIQNDHVACSKYDIGTIIGCDIAIYLKSGVTYQCEANVFNINYIANTRTAAFYLDSTGKYRVTSNRFNINVVENHSWTNDQVTFLLTGSNTYQNSFIVSGANVPPIGTGQIIRTDGNSFGNYFEMPYFDPALCFMGAGQIVNTLAKQFGYPGPVGAVARSVVQSNAVPNAGKWLQGDVCWNMGYNATGQTLYWLCKTSGTPGAWDAITAGSGGGLSSRYYPSMLNSWQAYSSGMDVCYYTDASGLVHLEGTIKSGSGNLIAILPAGFRPSVNRLFVAACNMNGDSTTIAIYTDGQIVAGITGPSYLTIDGISFRL